MNETLEQQRQQELARLQSLAEGNCQAGSILLVLSLVALFWTYTASGSGIFFIASAAFFMISLTLLILGQLLHIRAALEKLSLK